jgi:hypothetical protein
MTHWRWALVLTTVSISVVVWAAFFRTSPVIVDGRIFLGQEQSVAEACLESAGFRRQALNPDRWLYKIPPENGSEVKNRFIKISFQNHRVKEASGVMSFLEYKRRVVKLNSTILEAKSIFGEPSWEMSVGDGDYGLSYKRLNLYLVFTDSRLAGFSLGQLPVRGRAGS